MKLLNIKDNSQQKKGTFSHIENLTGKIADKTLEQLEHEGVFVFPEIIRDSEDIITKDQMILCSLPRKTQKTDKQNTKKSAREKTSWRI